ncbi:MAG: hypothetical protein C4539_11615 [Ignavibacteriales bacterium]|nr:MAG: hypothetical protein C4539_11615 [Ignavibacteriales bacterium]
MKRPLFSLALIILYSGLTYCNEISDIIELKKLKSGNTDTLVVADLFYSPDNNLVFDNNPVVKSFFIKDKNLLVVSSDSSFSGYTVLNFKLKNTTYSIPFLFENTGKEATRLEYKFSYKPEKKINSASVFGSFNNWNKEANPMIYNSYKGSYEATIPLIPGRYNYKFFVDGKEIVDPENPDRTPTGFDDFNSVLTINASQKEKCYLHIDNVEYDNVRSIFNFIYERENQKYKLITEDVFLLLDNQRLPEKFFTINKNRITVTLPKHLSKGDKTLRIAVSQKDNFTNMQSIILTDGKPAGHSHSFNWQDGIIYSIMIDRFNDGDKTLNKPVEHDSLFYQANYQGGDLQGIINKIDEDYFTKLGINVIWISPVYDNPNDAYREFPKPYRWYSGYHGYWPVHHQRVEEKFGTIEKLKELVNKAHSKGINVLLDFVAHHVHIEHPFYKEHPEWFGKLQLPDGRLNLRFWDEFRLTTWFEPYMPSFDFLASKEAIDTMAANGVWWLQVTGADGFRHDAVKHVPNEYWRALTEQLKINIQAPRKKQVYQIGETFGNHELVKSYVNNGQLSAQFDFDLSYFAIPIFLDEQKSFTELDFHLKKSLDVFGTNHLMGNIMDSHDKVRFMAYADGDIKMQGVDTREIAWSKPPEVDHPESYKKAELFLAFMHTIPGLPVIYYGSEFGMTGADDPDNRRMMRFGDQLTSNEKQMLEKTKVITDVRNKNSALRYGDFQTVLADNFIYAYIRCDFNEKLLVILNKGAENKTADIKLPDVYSESKLTDVVSNETFTQDKDSFNISIPAYGWKVLKLEK